MIYKLKDICLDKGFIRGPFGSALKKDLFISKCANAYKVYEQCVPLEQDKYKGHYYISKEYFESNLKRFEVKNNDFLISCSGVNYGAIYHLEEPFEKGVINQALLIIRVNPEIVDYNYFKYLFNIILKKAITSGTGDSTIPNFPSIELIKNIEIDIPNLNEQRKIGSILSSIDTQIQRNNDMVQKLQVLTQSIYSYWFNQFEFPNEEGKSYKSSGGEMIWNEELKREIPKDWSINTVKNYCNITWGQCPDGINILPLSYNDENTFLYCSGAGDMRNGIVVDCQAKTNASKRLAHKNDILMSIAGSIGALCICDKTISLGRAAVALHKKKIKVY